MEGFSTAINWVVSKSKNDKKCFLCNKLNFLSTACEDTPLFVAVILDMKIREINHPFSFLENYDLPTNIIVALEQNQEFD